MKGRTSIWRSWIRRPRRWAGSVARAQQDFFLFDFVPDTSSEERLLTELTSATQDPLRGDILEFIKKKLNWSILFFHVVFFFPQMLLTIFTSPLRNVGPISVISIFLWDRQELCPSLKFPNDDLLYRICKKAEGNCANLPHTLGYIFTDYEFQEVGTIHHSELLPSTHWWIRQAVFS